MTVETAVVIWQGKTKDIEFSYTDFKGNKSRRNVSVNKVLFDTESENFYINGICNERKAERDFKGRNITTMIKVGSERYYFREWMLTLGLDIDQWLDSDYKSVNKAADSSSVKPSFTSRLEEYNRKQKIKIDELKANKATNPTQPSSNKFMKVLFWVGVFFAPYVFAWFTLRKSSSTKSKVIAFSWMIFISIAYYSSPEHKQADATNQAQTVIVAPNNAEPNNTKVDIYNQFDDLSDCQLAALIVADYEPIIISLSQYINSNDNLTYQQLDNWKNATHFQSKLDSVSDKYPVIQKLDMHNSRLASGLGFRAGQAFRDTFSGLRKSDNQGYEISPQWQFIQNEALQIIACKEDE